MRAMVGVVAVGEVGALRAAWGGVGCGLCVEEGWMRAVHAWGVRGAALAALAGLLVWFVVADVGLARGVDYVVARGFLAVAPTANGMGIERVSVVVGRVGGNGGLIAFVFLLATRVVAACFRGVWLAPVRRTPFDVIALASRLFGIIVTAMVGMHAIIVVLLEVVDFRCIAILWFRLTCLPLVSLFAHLVPPSPTVKKWIYGFLRYLNHVLG
jgi:hypothetical protein